MLHGFALDLVESTSSKGQGNTLGNLPENFTALTDQISPLPRFPFFTCEVKSWFSTDCRSSSHYSNAGKDRTPILILSLPHHQLIKLHYRDINFNIRPSSFSITVPVFLIILIQQSKLSIQLIQGASKLFLKYSSHTPHWSRGYMYLCI